MEEKSLQSFLGITSITKEDVHKHPKADAGVELANGCGQENAEKNPKVAGIELSNGCDQEVPESGSAKEDENTMRVKAPARSIIPGQCCIPPRPCDYQGLGTEETWSSLPVYITGSLSSLSAVLIICDIYGWQVPQTRQLADKVAAAGHFVVVPDFLENDYYASPDPNDEFADVPAFLARHSQLKAIEEAKNVIKKLQNMNFKSIGASGFCWGAKIVISLLKGDTPVTSATMCHPSFLTVEEIKAVKVPLAILAAEIDIVTTPEQATEFGTLLAASPDVGSKSYVKIYKGADHGWTTRYDHNDLEACKRAETAHREMISWFGIALKA